MYDTGIAQAAKGYQGASAINAVSPPQAPVASSLSSRLEQIGGLLLETVKRQKGLLERLHGERPEKERGQTGQLAGAGILGEIDARLLLLADLAQQISENQMTLDRLA